jgi:hypothetical protein
MRKTYFEAEWTPTLQRELDTMWVMIENSYPEDWRVEANGDMTLEVDEDMLNRVLEDHPEIAELDLETYEMHNPENECYEWVNYPEHLIGTYTIKGVYNAAQVYVNHQRHYFFTQEGF